MKNPDNREEEDSNVRVQSNDRILGFREVVRQVKEKKPRRCKGGKNERPVLTSGGQFEKNEKNCC